MLNALLGPPLYSVGFVKINTDEAWLGLGSLYIAALASKYFNQQAYSQKALEVYSIGEEVLSGVELFNEVQNVVASCKWTKKARANSSDFFAKRVQIYSQVFLSFIEIFCNAARVIFF